MSQVFNAISIDPAVTSPAVLGITTKDALLALQSNFSGAAAPASPVAFQTWVDTSTGLLKIRNAVNTAWVVIGDITQPNLGLAALLAGHSFCGSFTRDLTLAAGNQVITGIGFSPKRIRFLSSLASTQYPIWSTGEVAENNVEVALVASGNGTVMTEDGAVIKLVQSLTQSSSASLITKDPDGFTLNWAKIGDPTGVAYIKYVAEM